MKIPPLCTNAIKKVLKANNAFDFDDLLMRTTLLLR